MNENHMETILEALRRANVPRTEAELRDATGMSDADLCDALDALLCAARAAKSKKGKYALPEKLGLIAGRARFVRSGTAILRPLDDGDDLRIQSGRLCPMPDDLLLCRTEGAGECSVDTVCARGRRTLSAFARIERDRRARGRMSFERTRATAVPCDPRIPYAIVLDGDISFVRNNEIILVAIDEYPQNGRPIRGHAERVLGGADSMLARMRATAEDHGFPTEFPEAVEAEARALKRQADEALSEKRDDLRALLCFTIDGADSKDFDDAVSIEVLPSGRRRLGVHIADVSHYVRAGSPIDREAAARGTSLYLPGCTVPMLPEVLSNDLCSLLPDEDRLAMSLFLDVGADGRVEDHHLGRSIIRSRARLTYTGVNRVFEGAEQASTAEIGAALAEMRALARTLSARRHARGSIDFDLPEPKFVLNARCEPEEILCEARGEAERLIEEFMLLANETVARLARDTSLPFVYRVHDRPDPDRIRQLEATLNLAGAQVRLGEHPHSGALQKMLEEQAENDAIDVIRHQTLRALKRAEYSAQPLGHYALALEDYCHFTSPIRRYPDLTVHRMLKRLLDGRAENSAAMEARVAEIARDSSLREQESVRAERAADDVMKAAYMSHQIGRKFSGVVTGVTAWGVYVTLENSVEGLIHVSDLDDYYDYDGERQVLFSQTGGTFRLGMKLRVRVTGAIIERGEVNFELARNPFGT